MSDRTDLEKKVFVGGGGRRAGEVWEETKKKLQKLVRNLITVSIENFCLCQDAVRQSKGNQISKFI